MLGLGKQLSVPRTPTFADAVKVPKITGISKVQTPNVILVRSADEKKDLEEGKVAVEASIRPSKMGINIKRVTKTARGVILRLTDLKRSKNSQIATS